MLASKTRALVEDALFQVLDNSVFRILAVVVLLPILFFFVVGFHPDEVSLLWGTWSWSWNDIGLTTPDARSKAIDTVLSILIDGLGGVFGVLFCIAATAFFVPRMIEKGAADLLFHKPISRAAFYFSRYLAGLFFVSILSTILIAGVFAGLALVSRHVEPGIFWSTLTLTYVFTIIYSFCMLVGVVTRSTVAAILLTVLFWFFNSCVHGGWSMMEMSREIGPFVQVEDHEADSDGADETLEVDDRPALLRWLHTSLYVGHLILPKTGDAGVLGHKLRQAVSPPVYEDIDAAFRIERIPSDWTRLPAGDVQPGHPALAAELGEVVLAAASDAGAVTVVRRRPLETSSRTFPSGRVLERKEKLSGAYDDLLEALGEGEPVDGWTEFPSFGYDENAGLPRLDAANARATFLAGERAIEVGLMRRGDWIYSFELQRPLESPPDEVYAFVEALDVSPVQSDWYEQRFRAGAPLAYNPTYSVLSSLAFALLLLALGAWRLSRIDF
ncbi:MAG: ABC transporter permease [Planctomycetota bacterium]